MDQTISTQPTVITLIKNEIKKLKNNVNDFKNIREYKFSTNDVVELFNEEDLLKGIDKSSVDYLLYEELKFIQTEIAEEIACYKKIFTEKFRNIEEEYSNNSVKNVQTNMIVSTIDVKPVDKVGKRRNSYKNFVPKISINHPDLKIICIVPTNSPMPEEEDDAAKKSLMMSMKDFPLLDQTVEFDDDEENINENFVNEHDKYNNHLNLNDSGHITKDEMILAENENDTLNSAEIPNICTICDEPFENELKLADHYKVHTGKINIFGKYTCSICNKSMKWRKRLIRHLELHRETVPTTFKCGLCSKDYTSKYFYDKHMLTHGRKKEFVCELCNKAYLTKSYFDSHMETHKTSWKCGVCDKFFQNKSNLNSHKRSHTNERPYQCEICGKSYRFQRDVKAHALIHSGLRPFKCQYCPKDFMTRENCNFHECIHTNDRRFLCEICCKSFITKPALNVHKRKHNGTSTPHQCNICYKSFSTASYLVGHKRLHTGEKPFNCKVCGKAFNLEGHAKKHERWHAIRGTKPFDCDLCDKSFDTRPLLISHKRFHSNVRKYKCGVCNKGFVTKSHVQRHLKTHKTDDVNNYIEEELD